MGGMGKGSETKSLKACFEKKEDERRRRKQKKKKKKKKAGAQRRIMSERVSTYQ